MLASFVDSSLLWREKYVNEAGEIKEDDLENILLEILRLFPPFFGSLRVATDDFDLGDFHVEKGKERIFNHNNIIYLIQQACITTTSANETQL